MAPKHLKMVHAVYFTLEDDSPEAIDNLVEDCHKYLDGQEGVAFFAAGLRETTCTRPVNDQDFEVGLYVVFDSKQAHDTYQESPQHKEFIERNKANWKQVRVFDSTTC
ncbi:MAG: Dabb family protein [Phycisphaerae bacterium]|nr:Dabb family protein [Phycisphaerae bacterium]